MYMYLIISYRVALAYSSEDRIRIFLKKFSQFYQFKQVSLMMYL